MNWKRYQRLALRTGAQLESPARLTMGALGLAGEAGEVVDTIKKVVYHGHALDTDALRKELGDVLWYIALLLDETGISMDDVLETNIAKLAARYPEGFSSARSRNRVEAR